MRTVDPVGAGERLGVGHPLPQLERALEQRRGLAVGVHALGRGRGAHRGGKCRRPVAPGGQVVGDGGGVLCAGVRAQPPLERPPERQVQLGPLARQQVVVDDLAQERVTEPVDAVVIDDQNMTVDRLAQGVAERPRLEPARLRQQLVVEPLTDGDEPQRVAGRLGQPLDPQHQRVAQRVGSGAAAVEPGREQLLAEQRVAAGPLPQPLQQVGGGRRAEDVRRLLGQLVAAERLDRDPARARVELELREQRPQRVAAVQLVGAVGRDHEHPLDGQAAREERERLARRPVGPVQVLDHEQHRALAPERVEQRQQALEQPRLAALRAVRPGSGDPGQQRRHGGADRLRQRGVAGACERPQRGDEREVRQLAVAEVDGLARQHERAPISRALGELGEQPRLPDARLARHERERRPAGFRVGERAVERRQLAGAADQA